MAEVNASPFLSQARSGATAEPALPRIIGVLNAYAPNGANAGQAAIYADGTVKFFNEESLLQPAIAALRSVDLRRFGNRRGKVVIGRSLKTFADA